MITIVQYFILTDSLIYRLKILKSRDICVYLVATGFKMESGDQFNEQWHSYARATLDKQSCVITTTFVYHD